MNRISIFIVGVLTLVTSTWPALAQEDTKDKSNY